MLALNLYEQSIKSRMVSLETYKIRLTNIFEIVCNQVEQHPSQDVKLVLVERYQGS